MQHRGGIVGMVVATGMLALLAACTRGPQTPAAQTRIRSVQAAPAHPINRGTPAEVAYFAASSTLERHLGNYRTARQRGLEVVARRKHHPLGYLLIAAAYAAESRCDDARAYYATAERYGAAARADWPPACASR